MARGCKLKHKAVSKKKQSREQKASAKEFERATAWLRSQGIKSKLAIFSILMACTSKTFKVSLQEAADRWLQEVSVLRKIDQRARKFKGSDVQQTCFFALHTLFYLQFGRFGWSRNKTGSIEPQCPYADDAKNFILTLVQTNRCLCLCYTNYVLAAAEEFGYFLVKRCSMNEHVNIAVVYPPEQGSVVANSDCMVELLVLDKPVNLCVKPTVFSYKIYSILDSGFRDNWYIDVDTVERKFRTLYRKRDMNLKVTKHKVLQCGSGGAFTGSIWDTLVAVFNQISTRRDNTVERYRFDASVVGAVWGLPVATLIRIKETSEVYWKLSNKLQLSNDDDFEDLLSELKKCKAKILRLVKRATQDLYNFSQKLNPKSYPSASHLDEILNSSLLSTSSM